MRNSKEKTVVVAMSGGVDSSVAAGIDPIAVEDLMNIVANLKNRNIGVLITDHNVHETLSITDRAYLLFEGQILKEGTSEFLANDPEARKLYLGEKFRLDRY